MPKVGEGGEGDRERRKAGAKWWVVGDERFVPGVRNLGVLVVGEKGKGRGELEAKGGTGSNVGVKRWLPWYLTE